VRNGGVGADHSHLKQQTHAGTGGGGKAAGGMWVLGSGGAAAGAAAGSGGVAAGEGPRMTVPQRRWGLAEQYLWIMCVSASECVRARAHTRRRHLDTDTPQNASQRR
jgi:hypothetical protein